jgi:hypothetical protein
MRRLLQRYSELTVSQRRTYSLLTVITLFAFLLYCLGISSFLLRSQLVPAVSMDSTATVAGNPVPSAEAGAPPERTSTPTATLPPTPTQRPIPTITPTPCPTAPSETITMTVVITSTPGVTVTVVVSATVTPTPVLTPTTAISSTAFLGSLGDCDSHAACPLEGGLDARMEAFALWCTTELYVGRTSHQDLPVAWLLAASQAGAASRPNHGQHNEKLLA